MVNNSPSEVPVEEATRLISRAREHTLRLQRLDQLDSKYKVHVSLSEGLVRYFETFVGVPPGKLFNIDDAKLSYAYDSIGKLQAQDLAPIGDEAHSLREFLEYASGVLLFYKSRKKDRELIEMAAAKFESVNPRFSKIHSRASINLAYCYQLLYKFTSPADPKLKLMREKVLQQSEAAMHRVNSMDLNASIAMNNYASNFVFFARDSRVRTYSLPEKEYMLTEATKLLQQATRLKQCHPAAYLTKAECLAETAWTNGINKLSQKERGDLAQQILKLVEVSQEMGFGSADTIEDFFDASPSIKIIEELDPESIDQLREILAD